MQKTLFILLIFACFSPAQAGLLADLKDLKAASFRRAKQLESSLAEALPSEVDTLRDDYLEARARTDVLDRLIFFTDSHYKGGDEREFLKRAALTLAERDVKMPERSAEKLWVFLRNLAIVVDKNREVGQTAGNTLSAYLNYSSVLDPKEPDGFLKNLDYTNGAQAEAAQKKITKENVASLIEEERAKLEVKRPLAAPKPRPLVLTTE